MSCPNPVFLTAPNESPISIQTCLRPQDCKKTPPIPTMSQEGVPRQEGQGPSSPTQWTTDPDAVRRQQRDTRHSHREEAGAPILHHPHTPRMASTADTVNSCVTCPHRQSDSPEQIIRPTPTSLSPGASDNTPRHQHQHLTTAVARVTPSLPSNQPSDVQTDRPSHPQDSLTACD